ncbi:MAG: glycosyltransferase [Flavobacteriia bacterium]|nr:glycosyltransferase [Flavobacteriia bacterium]
MKVLIIGSDSLHVKNYIDELLNRKFDVYFISDITSQFEFNVKVNNVSFKSKNPYVLIKNYFNLKRKIKAFSPDIVHIHQVNRLGFVAAKIANSLKLPIVSTAWGSDVLVLPFKNFLYFQISKYTLKYSNVVTADAQVMIDSMRKIYPSSTKYKLLQYGIELVKPSTKENIIFSNRMHHSLYRIDAIILYFKEFVVEYHNWKLVIGGTGEETIQYKKLVSDLNLESKVEFTNWLDLKQNHEWYSKSSIYISIPITDGTSVSVLEAISAGCIVILSDLPVSHEWITDGVSGVIEKKGNNPFFEAMKLTNEQCYEYNLEKIKTLASREYCMTKFIEYYTVAKNKTDINL